MRCLTTTGKGTGRLEAEAPDARQSRQSAGSDAAAAGSELGGRGGVVGRRAVGRRALWRARRTMAATFAFGMGQLPESTWAYTAGRGGRGSDGRMLVWVVGACEAMEGQLSRRGLLAQTICRLWWPAREHGLELIL